MKINPSIFKEYDIRGIYPKEINEKIAYIIGASFVRFLGKKNPRIVVGQDLRPSAPPLAQSFIAGAREAGANIIDIGIATSPILYYATSFLKDDGGVIITASHNPKKYNGIKMLDSNGLMISGSEIKKFITAKKSRPVQIGSYEKIDVHKKYFEKVFENLDFKKQIKKIKIKLVSAGSQKLFFPELIKNLNLSISQKPDFYASFDYDSDRLNILNKNKKEIRGDIIGAIIGNSVAQKKDIIICDLRCSKAVFEFFRNKGIKVISSKVGHLNIKKTMRQRNAIFGMEITGHYYFKNFHFHESSTFALRKIIEQLRLDPKLNLAEPFSVFKKFFHSGIINIKIKNFEKLIKKLKNFYQTGAQNNMDGLTIEFSNWWFNIRPSKTEPLARMVIEANSGKILNQKKKELIEIIKNFS